MDKYELVEQIVDYLFTNGFGEGADRLVMMQANKNIGGWGKAAVKAYLFKILQES